MAKKPPQPPKPPQGDFDPERELHEEIVPIEEVDGDDLFDDVVADDGGDATKTVHDPKDHVLPDIEVEAEEVVAEVEADDLFAEVAADDGEGATKSMQGAKGQALPDVEVDDGEILAEVEADEALVDEVVDDEPVLIESEEVSPHEVETMAEMPVIESDDPFTGAGGEEVIEAGEEGELVAAGVGAGRGPVEPDEPYHEEEVPKPKLHWFTWTLIGLNVVAVLAAAYILLLDYHKRQQYAYAVHLVELRLFGVPNEDEEKALTAARVTLPGFHISPDEIKRIVKERGFSVGDKFESVDEQPLFRISPSALDKDILKDHFEGGESVATVEAEVRRLQSSVVPEIKKAAEDSFAAEKSDADKRKTIVRLLQSLAMDKYQAEKLDKRIKAAAGPDLEKLYMEAAERRMAFDFLLPLELFRPGETKGMFVESIGNLEALPLDKVLERVEQRIKSTIEPNYQPAIHFGEEWGKIDRDTIEKRLTISFTLLSLAHVKKPGGELLYPQLLERIPRVMGQYDFALACELFPSRILDINEKVLERIKIDREGFDAPIDEKALERFNETLKKTDPKQYEALKVNPEKYKALVKGGGLVRGNKSFIEDYEVELQRIRFMQNDIFKAKIRLKDLQDQKTHYETLLKERIVQRDDVLAKIAIARAKTAKDAAELRLLQDELFRYQVELATSDDELTRIHQEIRAKAVSDKGTPGGKQP